jgi:hypothetical protein
MIKVKTKIQIMFIAITRQQTVNHEGIQQLHCDAILDEKGRQLIG